MVEECINVVDGDILYNKTLSIDPNDCPSRTPYIVLFSVFLLISVIVGSTFIYFHWYKNKRLDLKDFKLLLIYFKLLLKILNIQRVKQKFIKYR